MQTASPHYLLFSRAADQASGSDQWQFVLQPVGGRRRLVAADAEPGAQQSRLELLAVVRGLEALDQPSRVTLLTKSRYVSRGIRRGLSQWRERHWKWERFGKLVAIRDHDLWRRVDRALQIHRVECCAWQWDAPPLVTPSPSATAAAAPAAIDQQCEPAVVIVRRRVRNHWGPERRQCLSRRLGEWMQALRTTVLRPAFTRAA